MELVTDRTVERFLLRLFLRGSPLRNLCIVAPFVGALHSHRFSLKDLRCKIEEEQIPTYIITRDPSEPYQAEAMAVLEGSPWIEVRYNASIHAKLYVATAEREAESFALFGSGNLTTRSIESNIELGILVYGEGAGRELLRELHYWANVRLRTLNESRLVQSIRTKRN
jgi:phosphatidylserine/phosphatidylglycerophosphate/cardiolipin synthase-like enzyme